MFAATAEPAVELRGVRKQFAGRTVLDGIELAIGRGEVFALVGPSGSGKSTILKMVSGIDRPDVGTVRLGGADVTGVPPHRRPVHTVFQNYALFPHLDVAGNVAFPLKIAKQPKAEIAERVSRALKWVRLDQFARRRVDTLSGGERQRVALARALVDDPACVLLDEPLSALDPHLRAATLELLQDIQARLHVTYLYVTHDREEALRAAHRIGVLNQGRLEQIGSPEDIYRRPRTPFVASFVGRINWFAGEVLGNNVRLADGGQFQLTPGMNGDWPDLAGAGKRVRVGVRPEDIELGEQGYFSAEVVNRQFSGASLAVRLNTAGGTSVAAELRDNSGVPPLGGSAMVSWRPESAHVFADTEGRP